VDIKKQILLKITLLVIVSTIESSWSTFSNPSTLPSNEWLQQGVPIAAQVLFWALLTSLLVNVTHHALNSWEKQHPGITIPKLLRDLSSLVIWSGFIVLVLSGVFEIDVTALLTASGLAIAVIGFALRSMISDIFTGIALGIERPFRIGDWVQVDDYAPGKVIQMNWRSTTIETEELVTVIFSNSLLATKPFQNYSRPHRYFRDSFTIALDSTITTHKAERIFLSAISQVSESMKINEKPEIRIKEFSSRGIHWEILYWVENYAERFTIRHEIQRRMLRNMHYSGIEVAADRIELEKLEPDNTVALENKSVDLHFIRTLPLFQSLNSSELDWLQYEMKRVFFQKGSRAVHLGDKGNSLFIVQEGIFDAAIQDTHGKMVSVGHLIPGTFFGEMSLLTGAPRSATITAEVDSIAYELNRDTLTSLFTQRPAVMEELSISLAERQLQNSDSLKTASNSQIIIEKVSLAKHFMGKIRQVFGFTHQEKETPHAKISPAATAKASL
jgi:small-conductance mechanosensitive channel